ncbi:MAG: hypothetical protein PHQ22_10470 [Sulfuricurvum sp.]|nr:hypothetical protein [Sulfuricurvum sp.]
MIKRLFLALLLLPILCGFNGNMQGGFDGKLGGSRELGAKIAAMPPGLTFYADYTDGRNGINADWSLGDGTGYYSGLSKQPDLKGGYHATTANKDVLKYKIDRNRTAAQETIIIKFTLDASDHALADHFIQDTDAKQREMKLRSSSGGKIRIAPNLTDASTINAISTLAPSANTQYVIGAVFQTASPNVLLYWNDGVDTISTTNTWNGVIAWGSFFYVGCRNAGDQQLDATIASSAFFNRALSVNEIAMAIK